MYNNLAGSNQTKIVDDNESFNLPLDDDKHEPLNASFVSNFSINTTSTSTFWSPSYINEVELEKKVPADTLSETTEEDICEFGIGSLDD